MSMTVNL